MTVPIHLDQQRSYNIRIDALETMQFASKVLIVTNPKIAGLHLAALLPKISAKEVYVHTIPDGEQYKNWDVLESILDAAFTHRLDRSSRFIAFGGGVIGDMTGFAAGIFQRGIPFVQIPTTLLSQVDASVGGKTGINSRFGKNLIGLFHQPEAVHIDPVFLKSLPPREFGAGIAEIIKIAVTFNAEFFSFLEDRNLHEEEVIRLAIKQSVETKARVVSQDEKENGLRAALNYGHTFGHVIENLTGYSRYLHGEAVAIGMCMANKLSCALGLMEEEEAARIKTFLLRYGLPVHYKIEDVEAFYSRFFLDKKSRDSKLMFILPSGIGNVVMKKDIEKEQILDVLEAFACESGECA